MVVHPEYQEEKDHGDSASDGSSSDSGTSSESEADAPSPSKGGWTKAATVISLEEAEAGDNGEEGDDDEMVSVEEAAVPPKPCAPSKAPSAAAV
jgi:hypothetical protein